MSNNLALRWSSDPSHPYDHLVYGGAHSFMA